MGEATKQIQTIEAQVQKATAEMSPTVERIQAAAANAAKDAKRTARCARQVRRSISSTRIEAVKPEDHGLARSDFGLEDSLIDDDDEEKEKEENEEKDA